MVSTRSATTKSSSPCTSPSEIDITVTFMFQFFQFPSKLHVFISHFALFQSYSVVGWDSKVPKSAGSLFCWLLLLQGDPKKTEPIYFCRSNMGSVFFFFFLVGLPYIIIISFYFALFYFSLFYYFLGSLVFWRHNRNLFLCLHLDISSDHLFWSLFCYGWVIMTIVTVGIIFGLFWFDFFGLPHASRKCCDVFVYLL